MASTATANQAILTRLQSMTSFHPATADLFADWTLDPGDVVTVTKGEESFAVPIYRMNMEWKGDSTGKTRIQIESSGAQKRPPYSELKRGSYSGGRRQEITDQELVRHQTGIDRSDMRLNLWATEEQWDAMAQQYVLSGKSEFSIQSDQIQSTVLETGATQGVLTFDPNHAYVYGEKCLYNGALYRCTNENGHSGAWGTGADFSTVTSMQSQITQNASNITLEVQNRVAGDNTLSGRINVQAGRVDLVVTGSGSGATINTGNIFLAMNGDGTTSGGIKANKVLLGSGTLNDKVDVLGYLSVSDGVTIDNDTNVAGDLDVRGEGYFDSIVVETGGSITAAAGDITAGRFIDSTTELSGIMDVQISGPTNNSYELQFKRYGDTSWSSGGTFSRATTLSASEYSGAIRVEAQPQDQHLDLYHTVEGTGIYLFATHVTTNPSDPAARISSKTMTMVEEVAGKRVDVHLGDASGNVVGSISTQATYNSVDISSISRNGGALGPTGLDSTPTIRATASNTAYKDAGLSMVSTSYNPSGSNPIPCVDLYMDSTLIGRVEVSGGGTGQFKGITKVGWDSTGSVCTFQASTTETTASATVNISLESGAVVMEDTSSGFGIGRYMLDNGVRTGKILGMGPNTYLQYVSSVELRGAYYQSASNTYNVYVRPHFGTGGFGNYTLPVFSMPATDAYNAGVNSVTDRVSKVKYIGLDSGRNHAGDWWNAILYDSNGSTLRSITTDGSTQGLYLPSVSTNIAVGLSGGTVALDDIVHNVYVTVNKTTHSNCMDGLTGPFKDEDQNSTVKLYYLKDGQYKSAGTYVWYHRNTEKATFTAYT